jgi:hypothetical protein
MLLKCSRRITTISRQGDRVAFIVKSEGAPGSALSYEDLASLWNSASKGNAVARIALAKLPAAERRLAEMVYKSFDGKPKKSKPKKISKREKQDIMRPVPLTAEQRAGVMFMNSPDPALREAARDML